MIGSNGTFLLMFVLITAGAVLVSIGFAFAADQKTMQEQTQTRMEEPIYGSQLMTEQERIEYRTRMRTAATEEERERIRNEHHERMKERAREQGMMLPDEPPAPGMGPGSGMGRGMGPGGRGMGGGHNR